MVGQILIDLTKLSPARVMVIYVTAGVILGAFGLYDPLINFAGCGASVPLCGFGNLLANGVKSAVSEQGLLGAFTGGLTASSACIASAVSFAFIVSLLFNPKEKS